MPESAKFERNIQKNRDDRLLSAFQKSVEEGGIRILYPVRYIGIIGIGCHCRAAITLMTWMQHSSETEFGKIVAVVSAAFLLAAVPMNHVIVASLEVFVALHAGVPFDYADWAKIAALAAGANMLGGLVLVTVLRLIQVVSADIMEKNR